MMQHPGAKLKVPHLSLSVCMHISNSKCFITMCQHTKQNKTQLEKIKRNIQLSVRRQHFRFAPMYDDKRRTFTVLQEAGYIC